MDMAIGKRRKRGTRETLGNTIVVDQGELLFLCSCSLSSSVSWKVYSMIDGICGYIWWLGKFPNKRQNSNYSFILDSIIGSRMYATRSNLWPIVYSIIYDCFCRSGRNYGFCRPGRNYGFCAVVHYLRPCIERCTVFGTWGSTCLGTVCYLWTHGPWEVPRTGWPRCVSGIHPPEGAKYRIWENLCVTHKSEEWTWSYHNENLPVEHSQCIPMST